MSNEIEKIEVECSCGSKDRAVNYDKAGQGTEYCDVCGTYVIVQIINPPELGIIPNNWIPEFKKTEISTGYVLKVWQKGKQEVRPYCIPKESIKTARAEFDKDDRVLRYAITFKDKNGNYQTQIFKG